MDTPSARYSFARDAFIYLLSYATLIIGSVSLNFLLKAITNRFIPDAVDRYNFLADDSAIIGFLAAVIIAFPIFLYLNYLANKMLGQGKMLHHSGVRTWLIYLTLVVVILIIIWQIIALFVAFLNGSLAVRFLLHTLITLLIAAVILGYQWWHLKFFDGQSKRLGAGFKVFEWVVLMVVAATVIGTFFIIDSPAARRAKRLDELRVESLLSIRDGIQTFYGWKGEEIGHQRLPRTLDELITDVRVYIDRINTLDPVTKAPLEYKVLGSRSYELCATFDTKWTRDNAATTKTPRLVKGRDEVFYHSAGRQCFELSVE